jgi:Na+-translocating ferredoxin:NAD+ oxidoreductase RNF subunit RnfB
MEILIPVLALAGLGLIFGVGLAIFSKRFSVNVDPRLEKIHGLLPGTNCGACGGAGCFGFAEGLLSGKMQISACRVSEDAVKERIAQLLGRAVDKRVKRTAVLHCNGGLKAKDRFIYQGINDCAAANLLLGGQKACVFGCLGFGSCVAVCPFGAITMSSAALPVVDAEKCKACNKCVLACPKKLFSLVPVTHNVYVACCSRDLGKDTKAVCPVGCIACGLCVKACRFDAIHVIDNLALIDYHKCTACGDCVKACPMGTIRTRP